MSRVFISHSSLDRDLVEHEVIAPLTHCGVETWYSKKDIKMTDDWEKSIRQGLKDCEWFLVVLTPRALTSEWVKAEVAWALKQRRGRIIPVMLVACDPEDLHLGLQLIQHIDFGQDPEQAIKEIVELLKPGRVPTHAKPSNVIDRPQPKFRPRVWMVMAVALMLLATLSLYWFISREAQVQPTANASETRDTPAQATPAQSAGNMNSNSSANANRPAGPRVTFTPLPERIKPSNTGGNK